MEENEGALRRWRQPIGKMLVGAAVKVHSARGPVLLESDDEAGLAEGLKSDEGFRAAIIVEEK
jgi:hypothetical protein